MVKNIFHVSLQHEIRYVQTKVRHRQVTDVLGPRRIPVSRPGAQQYQTTEAGLSYDPLSFVLSMARGRRLHALLHQRRYGDAEVDQRL